MKKVRGMPITGTNTQTSMRKPFIPNAKDTSSDAQTQIAQAPQPFKNRLTTAQMTTGSPKAPGGVSTMEPKIQAGLKRSSAPDLPPRGPVGQRKPINQSGQVFGRLGTSHPRKVGQQGQGFPSKRNAKFYGE